MIKKLVFLSLFSIFLFSHSIGQTAISSPFTYKAIKLINVNFDDHVKALDFFIAKWKPLAKPVLRPRDFLGREKMLYYEEPEGIAGDSATRTTIYENSKFISQLILASRRPLDGLRICHEDNEESLTELDSNTLNEAISLFGEAYTLMREYSIRVYNINQDFQDLSDLHATRVKIIEGQAKLRDILARGPQKKN